MGSEVSTELEENPMKPARTLILAAPLALAAGCGGGGSDAFVDAAPSYSALSMDMTGSDTSAPSAVALTASPLTAEPSTAAALTPDLCHPHLFIRTHEVAARVNLHIFKFLRFVEAALLRHPRISTDGQRVWEWVRPDGVTVRFTITRAGDVFTWLLELEPSGGTTFVTVFSGEIDRTGATGPHQGKGTFRLDLTALHSVIPTEPVTGVIQASFLATPAQRELVFDAASVAWEIDPLLLPAGTTSAVVTALQTPRSAHYVYFREPGKGGSLKIKDQMVFLCPANPSFKLADAVLVDRWYRTGDGSRHGRADAQMTGGQLPDQLAPISKVEGVTCHQSPSDTSTVDTTVETYWLMKAEDDTGATLLGFEAAIGAAACDPLLNQDGQPTDHVIVPLLSGPSQDFDFSVVPFATNVDLGDPDNQPYPFPGM